MEEHKHSLTILKKKNPSTSDMRSLILKVRNNAFSFADTIVEFGVNLIRNKRSSNDEC